MRVLGKGYFYVCSSQDTRKKQETIFECGNKVDKKFSNDLSLRNRDTFDKTTYHCSLLLVIVFCPI